MEHDEVFKILLIGDQAVGKTTFMVRFCEERFSAMYICTIGLNFKSRVVQCKGKSIKVNIFDPTGQERYRAVPRAFYSRANGVLLSFDLTSINSFQNIMSWVDEIDKSTEYAVPKVLVGTKCDLESDRVVSVAQAEQLAQRLGIPYFETSAKDDLNVEEAVMALVESAVSSCVTRPQAISLLEPRKRNPSKCCRYVRAIVYKWGARIQFVQIPRNCC